jgi:hypothetical protein
MTQGVAPRSGLPPIKRRSAGEGNSQASIRSGPEGS